MSWRVAVAKKAAAVLRRLSAPDRQRIAEAIDRLTEAPTEHPPGRDVKPLEDTPGLWRLRVGDWRVLYAVQDAERLVYAAAVIEALRLRRREVTS